MPRRGQLNLAPDKRRRNRVEYEWGSDDRINRPHFVHRAVAILMQFVVCDRGRMVTESIDRDIDYGDHSPKISTSSSYVLISL